MFNIWGFSIHLDTKYWIFWQIELINPLYTHDMYNHYYHIILLSVWCFLFYPLRNEMKYNTCDAKSISFIGVWCSYSLVLWYANIRYVAENDLPTMEYYVKTNKFVKLICEFDMIENFFMFVHPCLLCFYFPSLNHINRLFLVYADVKSLWWSLWSCSLCIAWIWMRALDCCLVVTVSFYKISFLLKL